MKTKYIKIRRRGEEKIWLFDLHRINQNAPGSIPCMIWAYIPCSVLWREGEVPVNVQTWWDYRDDPWDFELIEMWDEETAVEKMDNENSKTETPPPEKKQTIENRIKELSDKLMDLQHELNKRSDEHQGLIEGFVKNILGNIGILKGKETCRYCHIELKKPLIIGGIKMQACGMIQENGAGICMRVVADKAQPKERARYLLKEIQQIIRVVCCNMIMSPHDRIRANVAVESIDVLIAREDKLDEAREIINRIILDLESWDEKASRMPLSIQRSVYAPRDDYKKLKELLDGEDEK